MPPIAPARIALSERKWNKSSSAGQLGDIVTDNIDYWSEKALTAVDMLASGSGTLMARLDQAWSDGLMRIQLHPFVEDHDLQRMFAAIQAKFAGPLDGFSEDDLCALASSIVSFYARLAMASKAQRW
jgi:hypothetical protein